VLEAVVLFLLLFPRLAELQGVGDIGEYLEEGAAAFAFPGRQKSWGSWGVGRIWGWHTYTLRSLRYFQQPHKNPSGKQYFPVNIGVMVRAGDL